jgi:hypothetical protein
MPVGVVSSRKDPLDRTA